MLHVFSLESGIEVLRVPACATVSRSLSIEDPFLVSGDCFITPLSISPGVDESPCPKLLVCSIVVRSDTLFSHAVQHMSPGTDVISWSCQKHAVL